MPCQYEARRQTEDKKKKEKLPVWIYVFYWQLQNGEEFN
jgi:hypothetical protein